MLYVGASMSLGKVRLVLHRPASAENVGAAARVMKNFGLSRLAIVAPAAWEGSPRSGGEGTVRDDVFQRASRLARHASDLLTGAEVHQDLSGALAPATWTCGTSSRTIDGRPRLSPRELAAEVVRRAAAGEVAVVFGEEQRGLSDSELELCQAVCTIPTTSAYDSMNLAQAVAVVSYELALAAPALAAWWRHYDLHCLDRTRPFPGIPELLTRSGRLLAVHTNKPGRVARRILAGLGLLDRFALVTGGDEAPRKPDPGGTLELMRRLGARPEETVFIGDSPTDVRTARQAGVPMVAVTWGFRPRAELRAAGAVRLVDRVAELRPWLE